MKGQYVKVFEELDRSEAEALKIEMQLSNLHLSMESYREIVKMLQSSRVENCQLIWRCLEARQKELLKLRESAVPQNQQSLMAKELLIARERSRQVRKNSIFWKRKFKAGQAHSTELLAAKKEIKLAELRLILAESKADSSNVQSSELSKLILDRAEKSARLAVVEKLLQSTNEAKPLIDSVNDSQVKIKDLQAIARRLSNELHEAELQSS